MIYLIAWIGACVWASLTFGLWATVVTFFVFLLFPPLAIAVTLHYMERNKISVYHLDLILIDFLLEREV